MRREDLTNEKFGKLTAREYVGNSKWLCECECGGKTVSYAYNLKKGNSKSCGCTNRAKQKDLLNKRIGKLVAIKFLKSTKSKKARWLCKCDCGNFIEVQTSNLCNGSTVSCGCHKSSLTSARNTTHGKTNTPEYNSWNSMVRRCTDPKSSGYEYYGGRGIKVCDRWMKYDNFYKDMHPSYEEGLTIDRIDVNGDYEPSNCKWSSMKEQVINRRCTKMYTYNGETMTLMDWARKTGIKQQTLYSRINNYGYSIEKALTEKVKK